MVVAVRSIPRAGDIDDATNRVEQARRWRTERILKFSERQATRSEWIQFSSLAERYGRNVSAAEGYRLLAAALLRGDFEECQRSRVLYLHPWSTKAKMTRGWLANIMEIFASASDTPNRALDTINRQYLGCCWVPRAMGDAWCASNLGKISTAPARRGRDSRNDSDYLAQVAELVARGAKIRDAARQAVAIVGWTAERGASQEATIERVRKKHAKGLHS